MKAANLRQLTHYFNVFHFWAVLPFNVAYGRYSLAPLLMTDDDDDD